MEMHSAMNAIINFYGFGIVQDLMNLHETLVKRGFSFEEFKKFFDGAKVEKTKSVIPAIEPKRSKPQKRESKKILIRFLKPGETEKMQGVLCSKCQGDVYTEALCGRNPLVKKGFLRKGICGTCGNEFGIR